MKTCFFVGHRDTPAEIQASLDAAMERLIREQGVTQFVVGHYGEFDRMATAAVQRSKRKWPDIYARQLLPYHPAITAVHLPEFFDDYLYPEGMETVPRRYAILKANQLMVEQSDWLVVYVRRQGGNAAKLYRAAQKKEKKGELSIITL